MVPNSGELSSFMICSKPAVDPDMLTLEHFCVHEAKLCPELCHEAGVSSESYA